MTSRRRGLGRLSFIAGAMVSILGLLPSSPGLAHQGDFAFGHPSPDSLATRTIRIDARAMAFVPSTLTVAAGETVLFVIHNDDSIDHEFVIGDAAEQAAHEREMASMPGMVMEHPNGVAVAPGATAKLAWTFGKAGTLTYACHVSGHFAAGMLGRLTVR
jgi:uncharacterized cupredoxin-like copper-binding protein